MNITPEAIALLSKLRLLLEAQTVDRQVLADAGSTPPPYLERIPDPKWAALLEVVSATYSTFVEGSAIGEESIWHGLPMGALVGALAFACWGLEDGGALQAMVLRPLTVRPGKGPYDPEKAAIRVVMAVMDQRSG